MPMLDLQDLARRYLADYESGRPESGDWSAWDAVDRLVRDDPTQAWAVVTELVTQSPTDEALFYIAAGPLEDLLAKHGPLVIDVIEHAAKRDPKIRRCLGGVWGNSITPAVWDRLMRLVRDAPN
jgi:CRISPR/Cas system-associated protein Csm6